MTTTEPKWKYGADIDFKKPDRTVNVIFLHCSASDRKSHDDVSVIKDWHVAGNGWADIGYHFFINKNGNIQKGRSIEQTPAAQNGHNSGSIAICLHGLKSEAFTEKQFESVKALCSAITDSYDKKIRIRGHCEVSRKTCPVFDYKAVLNLNDQGYYNELVTPDKKPRRNATSGNPTAGDSYQNGFPGSLRNTFYELFDKGPEVIALQKILIDLGFECAPDGVFGRNTEAAVKRFQKSRRLHADGVVGRITIGAMFPNEETLKRPAKGLSVRVLQLLLRMYQQHLMIDGVFGSGTYNALVAVQRLAGLKPDGVFGPKTRASLT